MTGYAEARQRQRETEAEAELYAVEAFSSSVMVLPIQLTLSTYMGDTLTIRFTFTDGTNPVNMTGTWAAQIRANANDPDPPVATFTIDTTNAATGVIVATLDAISSRNLTPGTSYVWDMQLTTGAVITTTHAGTITTTQDVTRP